MGVRPGQSAGAGLSDLLQLKRDIKAKLKAFDGSFHRRFHRMVSHASAPPP
jgi:hypothetical protein